MDDPVVRFLGLLVALIPIVPILLFVVAWGMPRRNWEFVGTALFFGASVAFIAVFASAVLALGTESLTNAHLQAFVGALLVVALPEEFVKFLPLVFILMRHNACRGPADVMVGVGLGFAALENVFYVMEEGGVDRNWLAEGIFRCPGARHVRHYNGLLCRAFLQGAYASKTHAVHWIGGSGFFHAAYDFPIFAIRHLEALEGATAEALPDNSVFIIAYFVAFAIVILLCAIVGFHFLNKGFMEVCAAKTGSRNAFETLLNRKIMWVVMGAIVAASAIVFVALAPMLFHGYSRWMALPGVIFPLFFAASMYRFGCRLPKAGAT